MRDDVFDVENLRIEETPTIAKAMKAAKHKRKNQFIKMPIEWKIRLAKSRRAYTFIVALEILYRNWKSNGKPFPLPTVGLNGVSRIAKWRALKDLEKLGLIEITRRRRKSPLIAILDLAAE